MEYKSVKIYAKSYNKITAAIELLGSQDYFLSRARVTEMAISNFLKSILKIKDFKNGN